MHMPQIHAYKFLNVYSQYSNQELVEKLKENIWQQRNKEQEYLRAAEMTKNVLNSNRATLIDLILKLEESDENVAVTPGMERDLSETADTLSGRTSNHDLIQVHETAVNVMHTLSISYFCVSKILSKKLKRSLIATRQLTPDTADKDDGIASNVDTLNIPLIDVSFAKKSLEVSCELCIPFYCNYRLAVRRVHRHLRRVVPVWKYNLVRMIVNDPHHTHLVTRICLPVAPPEPRPLPHRVN